MRKSRKQGPRSISPFHDRGPSMLRACSHRIEKFNYSRAIERAVVKFSRPPIGCCAMWQNSSCPLFCAVHTEFGAQKLAPSTARRYNPRPFCLSTHRLRSCSMLPREQMIAVVLALLVATAVAPDDPVSLFSAGNPLCEGNSAPCALAASIPAFDQANPGVQTIMPGGWGAVGVCLAPTAAKPGCAPVDCAGNPNG